MSESTHLTGELKRAVLDAGIDLIGVTTAEPLTVRKDVYEHTQARALMSDAHAVVVAGFCVRYTPRPFPSEPGIPRGRFTPYGSRAFKQMDAHCLETIGGFLRSKGFQVADASQLPIKPAAAMAGLGTYGKHTVLVTPELGSWVMFSCFVTDAPLAVENLSPFERSGCPEGCDLCAKACPTAAITAPFRVERSKCVTDWLWGYFAPADLRAKQENRLFGCGECLIACPKNKHVKPRMTYPVRIDELNDGPELIPLLQAEKEYFLRTVPSFALEAGIEAIRGNAIIALGNIGDPAAVEGLSLTLRRAVPQNRAYSAWALGRIGGRYARRALKDALKEETERSVIEEITRELDAAPAESR